MQIEHMPINFEDARGYIRDIIVAKEVDSVSLITCAPGAARGNHFHKQTIQYTYVLSGRLTYATQKPGQPVEIKEVVEGDLTANPPLESHAFKAIEQSVILQLSKGPRQGDNYENDTFRLEVPLLS
jgi:quercetin dioxygenase-like cupin family protein